jgi:hypothetical protein
MDANFNQEASSARTLRLQKKNEAPSTAQSHSHASTVEAQRTFSQLEQVAHRQNSPNIHARTSINAPTPSLVYTPVVLGALRDLFAILGIRHALLLSFQC